MEQKKHTFQYITEAEKHTFQKVIDFMQCMDGNGIYYTIMEDLDYINKYELITEILNVFRQWKNKIINSRNETYKAICVFEYELIAMLET